MSGEFTVDLPSRGLHYGGALPEGKIMVRAMGEAEEALLFQRSGDPVTKIARILDNCYVDENKFPAQDLLETDRLYILFMLRVQMFGASYRIPYRCDECRFQGKRDVDLMEELETIRLKDGCTEPFEALLPDCDQVVQFRGLRGSDSQAIRRKIRRAESRSKDDEAISDPTNRLRIARQITAIDEADCTEAEAEDFAHSLTFADAQTFRTEAEKYESGLDPRVFVECPKCGFDNELTLPLTADFFRPSSG